MSLIRLLKGVVALQATPAKYRRDYWRSLYPTPGEQGTLPLPWINYRAIEHLDNLISPGTRIFEYGSGASTAYWVKRGCVVTSVEHDRDFFGKIGAETGRHAAVVLLEPKAERNPSDHAPASLHSFHSSDFPGFSFEDYVRFIDRFPDESFDLILIDGRARPSCINSAVGKVKRGGVLVLDNSDRKHYLEEAAVLLQNWPRKTFRGAVRGLVHQEQTTVFRRP